MAKTTVHVKLERTTIEALKTKAFRETQPGRKPPTVVELIRRAADEYARRP